MKRIPTLASVMTPFPYSIGSDADIAEARAMMAEHEIHHLPVMHAGKLVGLLWDRDIRVARALETDLPREGVEVGTVCNREPYVVDIGERLDRVADEIAHRRVAAAIVMRGDKLAGILTTTDICRLLAETLRAHAHVSGDDGDGDAA
jgi:acetoin utilization protein AcuB